MIALVKKIFCVVCLLSSCFVIAKSAETGKQEQGTEETKPKDGQTAGVGGG